jgi:hypothetical protein
MPALLGEVERDGQAEKDLAVEVDRADRLRCVEKVHAGGGVEDQPGELACFRSLWLVGPTSPRRLRSTSMHVLSDGTGAVQRFGVCGVNLDVVRDALVHGFSL